MHLLLDSDQIEKLKYRCISSGNVEDSYADIWITPDGDLFKVYNRTEDETLSGVNQEIENDIQTLKAVISDGEIKKCKVAVSFALPTALISKGISSASFTSNATCASDVSSETSDVFENEMVIGYRMPYIKGRVLSLVIHELPFAYFYKICADLYQQIIMVNQSTDFSICDIHEDNIVIGEDGVTYQIDMDGWFCQGGAPRRSRYLAYERDILSEWQEKYRFDDERIYADINTDLFCWFSLFMNYFCVEQMLFSRMSVNEKKAFLIYLDEKCKTNCFTKIYETIYSSESNEKIFALLEENDILNVAGIRMEQLFYVKYQESLIIHEKEDEAKEYLESVMNRWQNQ